MCIQNVEIHRCGCPNPNVQIIECHLRTWQGHVTHNLRSSLLTLCPQCIETIQCVHTRATEFANRIQEHLGALSFKLTKVMGMVLYINGISLEETAKLDWAEQQLSFIDTAHKRVEEVEKALAERATALKVSNAAPSGSVAQMDALQHVYDAETALVNAAQSLDAERDLASLTQLAEDIEETAMVSLQYDYVLQQLDRTVPTPLRRICATCGQVGRCICQSRAEWARVREAFVPSESMDDIYPGYIEQVWQEIDALEWEWENEIAAQAAAEAHAEVGSDAETVSLASSEDANDAETASLASGEDASDVEMEDLYE